jgi:hypothetical protein
VELRQYTLHPGKRDVLIELFDREFIESQEAVGIKVIGQFRDLDDPNRFVWLRGFRDMPSRAKALEDFYGGPVWGAHREAANATMVDFDDVLLVRPALPTYGFSLEGSHPAPGAEEIPRGLVVATVYQLSAPAGDDVVDFFERASILALFVTENSTNTFPALPVREGENVLVSFSRFRDDAAYEKHVATLAGFPRWKGGISARLARRLNGPPQILKLSPTARSHLHG